MSTIESESEYFSPYRADGKLYGFVCVVTGADSPMGAAVLAELAAHGAASIYACSQESTLPPFPSSTTTQIIPYPNLTPTEHATLALIDEALNTFGRLDVWVCTSLTPGPLAISKTSPTDLSTCFEANAIGPFFALKYAPAAMAKTTGKGLYGNAAPKDQPYGSIIVISSTDTEKTDGKAGVAFTMSSHAALGLVRSGVNVLKGSGVRINCISQSGVDLGSTLSSDQVNGLMNGNENGLKRKGLPAEVGRVVGFLASGFSSYISGTNLVVDGGAGVL